MEQAKYPVDKKVHPYTTIAHVPIGEFLVGIPWTTTRARQHVINKVSQTLHKVVIFNNNLSNPFKNGIKGIGLQVGPRNHIENILAHSLSTLES